MQIRIFGQPDCVWCARAKALCETRAYDHSYTDLTQDSAARAALVERLGADKFPVPQIFVGDRLVGGFTQLALADNSGELQQMIGGE
ncbi:glutaredoxin family protein [Methylorubrum extorquens]|uniref:glutaredoxin family protein n=1 Tax=Methylorubrum extorquens TaxID=408 RepID=UPI00209EE259|nr:glutaredoxin domain-containing protein [Methylorubrum extorquens]MCP1540066.1 glutaredoxin 1 [Methylorubrum extorquens]